jgi:hypothetical protein
MAVNADMNSKAVLMFGRIFLPITILWLSPRFFINLIKLSKI